MIFDTRNSSVFGGSEMQMESTLKNPNQYKEAVIECAISSLPRKKINEFVNSKEAKAMINEGLISQDCLDRLASENDEGRLIKTTVCHMAKENGDPTWDEFVRCRTEERRLMNDMLEKYGDNVKPEIVKVEKEIIESSIPEYFRTK